MSDFTAPFPYFGGKRAVAGLIWERLGDVPNYVEPFYGSGAVLLARPDWHTAAPWIETVNDADGMVSNFWRALQSDPVKVEHYADWPVNENDLHARHAWLVGQRASLASRLEGDPDYCDHKIAGWWVWGLCCWIGGGWCSGDGPWHVIDGELVKVKSDGQGISRKRVHLGNAGKGIKRRLVHLRHSGQGINSKRVQLGDTGKGKAGTGEHGLTAWLAALSERLARVRVCSGDWLRVMGPTPTVQQGLTGIFLDPPYSDAANRDSDIYSVDDLDVAHAVRRWCLEHGDDPRLRLALCGYRGEHDDLEERGWTAVSWKTQGGYANNGNGNGRANAEREVIWFSPHCLKIDPGLAELPLFGEHA